MSAPNATAEAVSTRDAILDAAEQRFADHGFAGASVREIAHDVGLRNQASLYHYFESKEALYEAVLRRGVDELLPIWRTAGLAIDASAADTRQAAIGAYLDRVFDYLVDHPHLARLIERAGTPDDVAAMVAFLVSDHAGFITGQVFNVDGGVLAHAPSYADMRAAMQEAER